MMLNSCVGHVYIIKFLSKLTTSYRYAHCTGIIYTGWFLFHPDGNILYNIGILKYLNIQNNEKCNT